MIWFKTFSLLSQAESNQKGSWAFTLPYCFLPVRAGICWTWTEMVCLLKRWQMTIYVVAKLLKPIMITASSPVEMLKTASPKKKKRGKISTTQQSICRIPINKPLMAPGGWIKVSFPRRDSAAPPDHELLLITHLHCTLVSQALFHTLGHRLIKRFPKAEEVDTWQYKKVSWPQVKQQFLLITGLRVVFTQMPTPKVQTSGKQTGETRSLSSKDSPVFLQFCM